MIASLKVSQEIKMRPFPAIDVVSSFNFFSRLDDDNKEEDKTLTFNLCQTIESWRNYKEEEVIPLIAYNIGIIVANKFNIWDNSNENQFNSDDYIYGICIPVENKKISNLYEFSFITAKNSEEAEQKLVNMVREKGIKPSKARFTIYNKYSLDNIDNIKLFVNSDFRIFIKAKEITQRYSTKPDYTDFNRQFNVTICYGIIKENLYNIITNYEGE